MSVIIFAFKQDLDYKGAHIFKRGGKSPTYDILSTSETSKALWQFQILQLAHW